MGDPPIQQPDVVCLENPFGDDMEGRDVIFIVKDVKLFLHSTILRRISTEFNKILSTPQVSSAESTSLADKTADDRNVIQIPDFEAGIVIKAFSFYYPKYFKDFQDENDFTSLLKLCAKYDLEELKEHIHTNLLKIWYFKSDDNLKTLDLAEQFGLEELRWCLLTKKMSMTFKSMKATNSFSSLSLRNKYEIIKKCILDYVKKYDILGSKAEVEGILSFLDLLFYEDKILDHSVPSKFSLPRRLTKRRDFVIEKAAFTSKSIENDVTVKIEGIEIYISSVILSENSPVFRAMLNSTFKEGQDKIINLPGKSASHIIELFSHFTNVKVIDSTVDHINLLPLCREYQVDWLIAKIKTNLENMTLITTEEKLSYLRIANEMEFQDFQRKILDSLDNTFIVLQTFREFTLLDRKMKFEIALTRLCKLLLLKEPTVTSTNTTSYPRVRNPPPSLFGTPLSQFGTPPSQFGPPPSQFGTPPSQFGTPHIIYNAADASAERKSLISEGFNLRNIFSDKFKDNLGK